MGAFFFHHWKWLCGPAMLAALPWISACNRTSALSNSADSGAASSVTDSMLADVADGRNWASYGRTFDESHFSPLDQINVTNVGRLGLKWSYDLPASNSASGTPIAIDGVLYTATGLSIVRAFHAETGRLLWEYDPEVAKVAGDLLKPAWGIRGLAYADGRIFVGTQDGRLIGLEAESGKPVWTTQTTTKSDGRYITGAPRVFGGKVIIGHGGADYAPIRGYVTAYDQATGKQIWRFYTVPGDPAKGFENDVMAKAAKTWKGEQWKHGGGGTVWDSMTYDPKYNRIYIGTGNGFPWNQSVRSAGGGDNLFLCSIVALDADSGRYVWHYQTTPGESWDYNSAMVMSLATLRLGDADRDVILHAPKNGFFYVLDRKTGKLVSAKPFAQKINWATHVDEKTGRPIETRIARKFGPATVIWPGPQGAHSWQSMSFNRTTGLVYIPTINVPGLYDATGIDPSEWKPSQKMTRGTGFADDPITAPPDMGSSASALVAWDPVAQKRRWTVPQTGAVNGGVMSTAGGLVFEGMADGHLVAYDALSGKRLWSFNAQNGITAEPITYSVKGRQYVTVIAAYGGAPAQYGSFSAQFGWDYRTQMRRILTFEIGGKAKLPRQDKTDAAPFVNDPAIAANALAYPRGGRVFGHHCFTCHGVAAIEGGGAPDLRRSPAVLNREVFKSVVHDGALEANGMPRFGDFDDTELSDLRAYIIARAKESARAESGVRR